MKCVVLGAGRMGIAAAFDFAAQPDVSEVTVADIDGARAAEVAKRLGPKAKPAACDLRDRAAVTVLLRGAKTALTAASYNLNVQLAECAIAANCHLVDLGGNNDVVRKTLALDADAKKANVRIVPDCGLAPGMADVLAARLVSKLERASALRIRVGGLPQDRPGPLEYRLVFSVEGLINEYKEPALVVRGGKTVIVESLTEIEPLEFPLPFGALECFHTSGGLSTLPETFAGKIGDMEYKTIRYPGHAAKMKLLFDLGLATEQPLDAGGVRVQPRKVLEAALERLLSTPGQDSVLVRVEVDGERSGKRVTLRNQIVDLHDDATGFSAMARTTAFPAAIVALELGRDKVDGFGVRPAERWLDLDRFLKEVRARGIKVDESEV